MPGFKGVRISKYRHVFGVPYQKEKCYEGLKITDNAHDSNFCAVNPKFLAVVLQAAGGGSFTVIPLKKVGRLDSNYPKIVGHCGLVLDIKWSPFNDYIIASCSDDGLIKFWEIPEEGLTANLTEPLVTLRGHMRKVTFLEWHPTAANIIASVGYDYQLIIWNADMEEIVCKIDCHKNVIFSIGWNWDGSTMVTTCKDKKLRIIDPRSGDVLKSSQENKGHYGVKPFKAMFAGESNLILTAGFVVYGQRQIMLWHKDNLDSPISSVDVDSGSSSIFPIFDADSMVLFVAGKGDGSIRYYEVTNEKPYLHFLSQCFSKNPQRGLGSMPKRGLDTSRNEIMRFYKVCTVKNMIEPVSMIVPRRSDYFQPDLYPDTPGKEAALTSKQWVNGEDSDPILMSFGGGRRPPKVLLEHDEPKTDGDSALKLKNDTKAKSRKPEDGGDIKKTAVSKETHSSNKDYDTPDRNTTITTKHSSTEGLPCSLSEVPVNGGDQSEVSNGENVLMSPRQVKKKMLTERFLNAIGEQKTLTKGVNELDLVKIPRNHEWRSEESLSRSTSSESDKFEASKQKSNSRVHPEEKLERTTSVENGLHESPQNTRKAIDDDETESDSGAASIKIKEKSDNCESTQSRIEAWKSKITNPSSPLTSPKRTSVVHRQNTTQSFCMNSNDIPTAEIRPRITSHEKEESKPQGVNSPKDERPLGRVGIARARYVEQVEKRYQQQENYNKLRKQKSHSQEVDHKELEKARQKSIDKQAVSRTQSLREESELKSSSEFGVEQLRKAYLRQMEEIKQLKTQILLKDQRIKELEKELSNTSN